MTDTATHGPAALAGIRIGANPGARVEVTDDSVLVRYGDRVTKLHAGQLPAFTRALLTALVDGPTTLDIAADADPAHLARVASVLAELAEAGLIECGAAADDLGSASPSAIGMWLRVGRGVPLRTIQERLDNARPTVLGRGSLAKRITTELATAGAHVVTASSVVDVPDTDNPVRDVVVVVGDTDKDAVLEQWNTHALAGGRTWLPALPFDGNRAVVGPWTRPGHSACFTCYRLRRASAFPDPALVDDLVAAQPIRPVADRAALLPGVGLMQTALVVERVIEWLALSEAHAGLAIPGSLDAVEVAKEGVRVRHHRLFRVPRCPTCSSARDTGYPMIWFHPDGTPA